MSVATSLMEVDPESGLIKGVRFVPSPNCDARPSSTTIDVLIIHAISLPPGEFGSAAIEQLFCNQLDPNGHPMFQEICGLQVSAHVLVRRDGEVIQFVPFHLRAWHAGESLCEGRVQVNDFSVGVELEGCDATRFEPVQYSVLSTLTKAIMVAYPAITRDHIYGHCDIAPARKTDPGPRFDWPRYLESL
ncbi:MAG: 1,6-anhydro-N-acetylmuramyl-L-alanine amidase AmpD [Acidiferrobacterales bacterium]